MEILLEEQKIIYRQEEQITLWEVLQMQGRVQEIDQMEMLFGILFIQVQVFCRTMIYV